MEVRKGILKKEKSTKIHNKRVVFLKNNDGVPLYLIKRKIKKIRTLIVVRKFAYIYLRKTHGKILPSQACKWRERVMLRKTFEALKDQLYYGRYYWRIFLRADIHYNFHVKKSYFLKWKLYVVLSKFHRRHEKLISMIYKAKLVRNSFQKMKNYKNIISREKLFKEKLLRTYSVVYRLYWAVGLFRQLIFERKIHILNTITKRLVLKEYEIADRFFKLKHNIQDYRFAFDFWKLYCLQIKFERVKRTRAKHHYKYNLKRKAFYKLYKNYTQAKKYRRKLFKKCFRSWKKLTIKRIQNKRAQNHNELKIKTKIFAHWKKYHFRCLVIRRIAITTYTRHVFRIWRNNVQRKIKLRLNRKIALIYNKNKIKTKYFRKLIEFTQTTKAKYLHNTMLVYQYCTNKSINLKSKCFTALKLNWKRMKQIRLIFTDLETKQSFHLKKLCFHSWNILHLKRKIKRYQIIQADLFFEKLLIRSNFSSWNKFTEEKRMFKLRLEHAQRYNCQFSTNFVFKRMIHLAALKRAKRYRETVERNRELFYVKLFYWNKWRSYILNKKIRKKNGEEQNINIQPIGSLTHLKPKIPYYLKK